MRIYFDNSDTLHIAPETSIEAMALKYWAKEYDEHGSKVLEVGTEVPMKLEAPK